MQDLIININFISNFSKFSKFSNIMKFQTKRKMPKKKTIHSYMNKSQSANRMK